MRRAWRMIFGWNYSEYINLVLKKIVSFYNPQMVYLFGSQARNDANKDSR
ncbi:MAG: hypothetical protein ACOCZT_00740 [Halanaerobiales bacterium]